jgi:hypothetical protein
LRECPVAVKALADQPDDSARSPIVRRRRNRGRSEARSAFFEEGLDHLDNKEVRQMVKPTYLDATLMRQLAQRRTASGAQEAANWMWSDQFVPDCTEFVKKCPPGGEGFVNASISVAGS